MKEPRDSQRARLYRAERKEYTGSHWTRADRDLREFAAVHAWIDTIRRSRWWKARFGGSYFITVRDGRGRRNAGGWRNVRSGGVTLPTWSRNRLIVLHELAHALQPRDSAAHGPEFARIFLDLVRRWMGPAAARRLRVGMRTERVRVADRRAAYRDHVGPLAKKWRSSDG